MLPDALGDALGSVIAELRHEWERDLERVGAEARAIIAELKAECAELRGQLRERIDGEVVRLHAALREPQDGHTPTPEELEPLVEHAVQRRLEAIPVPKDGEPGAPGRDGKDAPVATREQLVEVFRAADDLIEQAVQRRVEQIQIPTPKDGEPGPPGRDGVDGKDAPAVAVEVIEAAVEGWFVEHPVRDGVDGQPGQPGQPGADALPVTHDVIEAEVERWLVAHPPRDGVDGKPGEKGEKGDPGDARDGRDGLPGVPGAHGERGLDGRDGRDGSDGRNGIDGLGFDDMTAEYDGERTVTLRWARGDQTKEYKLKLPIPIDQGIWRDGMVSEAADVVGFGGSAWIALRDTAEKPDLNAKDWRLLVKKGRDGKDGVIRGPQGPVKLS